MKIDSIQRNPYHGRGSREVPAYTTLEAARYLRIPERTLFGWAFGYTYRTSSKERRRMSPLIEVTNPQQHQLSFVNLAELHVLDALRRVHRIHMPKIRRTVLYLGREFDTDHPLIHSDMWTDGVNVFVEHYGHLVNASKEGQLAMRQLLDAHLHRIDRDLNGV